MKSTAPQPIPRPAFAQYIWERGLSFQAVAEALGCSHEQVRRICLPFQDAARRVPGPELMERIVEWTAGAVLPADFYPPRLNGAAEAAAQPEAAQ